MFGTMIGTMSGTLIGTMIQGKSFYQTEGMMEEDLKMCSRETLITILQCIKRITLIVVNSLLVQFDVATDVVYVRVFIRMSSN